MKIEIGHFLRRGYITSQKEKKKEKQNWKGEKEKGRHTIGNTFERVKTKEERYGE